MDPFPVPIPLDHQPPPPHHPPTPPPPQQQHQQPPFPFAPPLPPPPSIATAPTAAAAAASLPYPEMILTAITALKEKDGSSKVAIAKYIEQNFSNLPPNHSTLLTQHLRRLKSAGHVFMVKKSYKLPRSDEPVPTTILPNNHQQDALPAPPAQLSKTGRGRGRPPKTQNAVKAQPVSVPVGLVDQPPTHHQQQQLTPGKRGRGRPKKIGGPAVIPKVSTGSGKRPGRPKKLKPVRANFGPNGVAQVHAQAQAEAQPISYAFSEGNVPVQNVAIPRRRGRPKKLGSGVAVAAAATKPVGRPAGRPVGRPKKSKSRAGRPVGRPRKITTEAAAAQAGSTIGDLRRKLEYFQTKVKLVVDVLKPQLTGESEISAVAAIQELEGLATMDIMAPLREDAQQPPQQPAQAQS